MPPGPVSGGRGPGGKREELYVSARAVGVRKGGEWPSVGRVTKVAATGGLNQVSTMRKYYTL